MNDAYDFDHRLQLLKESGLRPSDREALVLAGFRATGIFRDPRLDKEGILAVVREIGRIVGDPIKLETIKEALRSELRALEDSNAPGQA